MFASTRSDARGAVVSRRDSSMPSRSKVGMLNSRISLATAELAESRPAITRKTVRRIMERLSGLKSKGKILSAHRSEPDWHYTRGARAPQRSRLCINRRLALHRRSNNCVTFRRLLGCNSRVPATFNFVNPHSYELEKIYSSRLRRIMRFRGPSRQGTDDGAWRSDGTDAGPRCSNVGFTGANANARRYNVKPRIRIPQVQRFRSTQ
jgi:hypothetical protein